MSKKCNNYNKIWSIVTIVFMIIIFIFSNQDGVKSAQVSDSVSSLIDSQISVQLIDIRKLAHIFLFACLGVSMIGCIGKCWKAGLYCYAYAVFDEMHQFFVNGREASVIDTFIDLIGICVAILVWCLVRRLYIKKKYSNL